MGRSVLSVTWTNVDSHSQISDAFLMFVGIFSLVANDLENHLSVVKKIVGVVLFSCSIQHIILLCIIFLHSSFLQFCKSEVTVKPDVSYLVSLVFKIDVLFASFTR